MQVQTIRHGSTLLKSAVDAATFVTDLLIWCRLWSMIVTRYTTLPPVVHCPTLRHTTWIYVIQWLTLEVSKHPFTTHLPHNKNSTSTDITHYSKYIPRRSTWMYYKKSALFGYKFNNTSRSWNFFLLIFQY